MASTTRQPMKMAPFRGMDDFILDGSKYLLPSLNDSKRFKNRFISNLLYYQTNYFAISAVLFLAFLLFGASKMIAGFFGIATTGTIVLFSLGLIPQLASIRSQYPQAVYGLGIFGMLVVYLTFRPILFFALSIMLPVSFWIVHASVRSRGLKNKISNKVEQMGGQVYANSPMSILLVHMGLDTKDIDE